MHIVEIHMFSKSKYCVRRDESARPAQADIDFTSPEAAVMEVERLLLANRSITSNVDEVWPKLYLGDMYMAENLARMRRCKFTHVLNCAHSSRRGSEIYKGMGITYMGIEASDKSTFDMSVHFDTAAEFIHTALNSDGKILVHCFIGVSRSPTIVLAYLMLKHNMTLVDAIKKVKERRSIKPNQGFLRQLVDLHVKLYGNKNKSDSVNPRTEN